MASKPGRKVSKRNDLTLQQKFKVMKAAKKGKKLGVRKLTQTFNCGKTQISGVLKNKAKIEELYFLGNAIILVREFGNQNILNSMICYTSGTYRQCP